MSVVMGTSRRNRKFNVGMGAIGIKLNPSDMFRIQITAKDNGRNGIKKCGNIVTRRTQLTKLIGGIKDDGEALGRNPNITGFVDRSRRRLQFIRR